jgi:acyl-CoA synthetase (AMP-forming)/AMP-acid ligase II
MGENDIETTPAPVDPLVAVTSTMPEKPAIIDGEVVTTYGELNAEVNRLANGLRALGVQPGERAVWCGPNSAGIVAFIHAARKIGLVAVPAAYRFTGEELQYLADNSDSVLVYVDAEQAAKFESVHDQMPKVRHVVVFGGDAYAGATHVDEVTAGQPDTEPSAEVIATGGPGGVYLGLGIGGLAIAMVSIARRKPRARSVSG